MILYVYISSQRKHGDARGGPFLAVHLRRADFVQVRKKDVPSLKHAAEQLKELAQKHNLKKIFVATDAPKEGKNYVISFEMLTLQQLCDRKTYNNQKLKFFCICYF